MRTLLLTCCCAALVATPAFANDASWVSSGDAGNYADNDQIQMVRENLQIFLTDEGIDVKVEFLFKNHGGPTSAEMAFPEESYDFLTPVLEDFITWVDGDEVDVLFMDLSANEWDNQEAVWIKHVEFDAHQSRLVEVAYHLDYAGSVNGDHFAGYTLTTGATWKDSIEHFECTVDWSALTQYSNPVITPVELPWTRIDATSKVLRLENLEPDFNLQFTMIKGFWNFRINGIEPGLYNTFHPYPLVHESDDIWIPFPDDPFFGDPDMLNPGYPYLAVPPWGAFFAEPTSDFDAWGHGLIDLIDSRTIQIDGKRTVTLDTPARIASPPEWSWIGEEPFAWVSMRSLVTGLGGTFEWDPVERMAVIDFPRDDPYNWRLGLDMGYGDFE